MGQFDSLYRHLEQVREHGWLDVRGYSHASYAEALLREIDDGGMRVVRAKQGTHVYDYDKKIWVEIDGNLFHGVVMTLDGTTMRNGSKDKVLLMNDNVRNGIFKSLMRCRDVYRPMFFEDAPVGVVAGDDFVRLSDDRKGINLDEPVPQHGCRWRVPWKYQDRANPARWLRFLAQVFEGDVDAKQKVDLLQEFIGVCLLGIATEFQRCLFLSGSGANGKSVFLDVVRQLFPEESVRAIPPQLWKKPEYAARLEGCLVNLVSETPERVIEDSSRFKAVISGDEVAVKPLFVNPYDMRPRAGHMLAANELPASRDHTQGFWRRVLVVEFNRDFSKDPNRRNPRELVSEILEEGDHVFSWALDGALRALGRGQFTEPDSNATALEEWQQDTNVTKQFRDGCLEVAGDEKTLLRDMHAAFVRYCDRVGQKPVSLRRFSKEMQRLGVNKVRLARGYALQARVLEEDRWGETLQ